MLICKFTWKWYYHINRLVSNYIIIQLQDLIDPSNTEIKIRESQENGVFINGITWLPVKGVADSFQVISLAEKNRVIAFTK